MKYTDNGNETYTDENGNTYSALNDIKMLLEKFLHAFGRSVGFLKVNWQQKCRFWA